MNQRKMLTGEVKSIYNQIMLHQDQAHTKGFLINPTYADDLILAGTNEQQIDDTDITMVERLKQYNLMVNETKKEKYKIPRPPRPPPPPHTLESRTN